MKNPSILSIKAQRKTLQQRIFGVLVNFLSPFNKFLVWLKGRKEGGAFYLWVLSFCLLLTMGERTCQLYNPLLQCISLWTKWTLLPSHFTQCLSPLNYVCVCVFSILICLLPNSIQFTSLHLFPSFNSHNRNCLFFTFNFWCWRKTIYIYSL